MRREYQAIHLAMLVRFAGSLASMAGACLGQVVPETGSPSAVPAGTTTPPGKEPVAAPLPKIDAAEFAGIFARLTARITLIDLKLSQRPGPTEYQLTRVMLEDALERLPEDIDLLRLLAETCVQGGDEARAIELTRKIHALDPSDKVVEMTLIASALTNLQTVGERVKALRTFLGPRGEGIDPGVRSRLALDLALLLREMSDPTGFSEALRQSLRLDPTNKEAAGLLHSVVLARNPAPRELVQSLLVLMAADPIDSAPSLGIARILARHGAVIGAQRFYDLHFNTVRAGRELPSVDVAAERMVALWLSATPAKVVAELSQPLMVRRRAAAAAIAEMIAAERPIDKLPKPGDESMPSELVRVWALAAQADGNEVFALLALDDLQANADAFARNALNTEIRGESMTEDEARKMVALRELDLLWIRCLTGLQTEAATRQVDALRINTNVSDESLVRLDGWNKVRRGEIDAGEALLRRQVAKGDVLAELGLAVAMEQREQRAAAAERFAALAAELRGTLAGAWALGRATALAGKAPAVDSVVAELEAVAAGVPEWMETLATNPSQYVTLSVRPLSNTIAPFSKASVEILVRNDAPIALAVGHERAINSRVLLTSEVNAGAKDQPLSPPEVVSLDRRFVLAPGEEMRVQAWGEQGLSAWIADLNACDVTRIRWRIVQGFRVKPGGIMEPGPFSLTANTSMVYRTAVPGCGEGTFDSGVTAQRLATATTQELIPVIAAVRYRLTRDEETSSSGTKPLSVQEKQTISSALAERYAKGDSTERTIILLMLPSSRFFKSLLDFDAALTNVAETDPRVLRYKLVTRAVDKDDPVLAAGDASGDETTRLVSQLMRKRLIDNPRTYSRLPSSGRYSVTGN